MGMENLTEILSTLIEEVPGTAMAALLGMDGIGVEVQFGKAWEDMDASTIEVELAALAEAVLNASQGLESGMSPEFFLGTTQANFVGAMLDESYFLILGLEPTADLSPAGEALANALEALA
jgi:predicted regulator of Ras-like GTPase activity (Roadblock/LC7/MglB family)